MDTKDNINDLEQAQLDFICMDEHGVIHFDRNGDGHADYYAKLQKGQTLKQEDIGQQKSGAEWMKFVDAQKVSKWADTCK